MNQPDNWLGAKKCLKCFFKAFVHTRIYNTSPVGMSIWDVGPAANHGYMKVSDALR